jgi:hypothetical protein
MNTATFIRDLESNGPVVRASLYRVDPPMTLEVTEYDVPNEDGTTGPRWVTLSSEYVRVSASNVPRSGPETYIFLADERGEPINWLECEGSYRGGLDHAEALTNAGYEIVGNPTGGSMSTQAATDCINDALARVQLIDARLRGLYSAIPNATRAADRLVLSNDAVSMHLDLSVVRELLRDARGSLRQENNA